MLAERTPDETTDATRPSARQHAELETAIRAAVAEGELASARARLRATEEALGETRDRAASLEARLRTAERNLIRREDVEALVRRVEEAERAAAEVAARRVARRGGIEGRAEADERRAVENVAGATENLRSDGGGASSSALVVSPGSLAPVLAAKKSSARTSASRARFRRVRRSVTRVPRAMGRSGGTSRMVLCRQSTSTADAPEPSLVSTRTTLGSKRSTLQKPTPNLPVIARAPLRGRLASLREA